VGSRGRLEGASELRARADVERAEDAAETAPCWDEISHDGQYLFTVNTASKTISSYSIASGGSLALLSPSVSFAAPAVSPEDAHLLPRRRHALGRRPRSRRGQPNERITGAELQTSAEQALAFGRSVTVLAATATVSQRFTLTLRKRDSSRAEAFDALGGDPHGGNEGSSIPFWTCCGF